MNTMSSTTPAATGAAGSFSDDDGIVAYPDEAVQLYRSEGLWGDRTIAQEFRATADAYPDNIALVCPDVELTYAQLDRQADLVALGLRGAGLRTGDKVLIQATNNWWTVLAWYGLLKAGLVPVATLAQHGRHEVLSIAGQCDAAAHLIEPGFRSQDLAALAKEVAAISPSVRLCLTVGGGETPAGAIRIESFLDQDIDTKAAREAVDDIQLGISSTSLAVLQLSGGTTSVPKLIPRLHSEYWYNAREWAAAMQIDSDGCSAHLLPLVHNAGVVCSMHAAHSVGAALATCVPDLDSLKAVSARRRLTHMLLTRPIAMLFDSDPELQDCLSRFDTIVWSDRAVPPEIVERYDTGTSRVVQMFGMGEGLCMITPFDFPPEIRHHTQGAPISAHDEVKVLEPGTEREVADGEPGELCVRGPYTIRGYYRAPERNTKAFTPDAFYRTGDIVVASEFEGVRLYRLEDRIKNLINRGGEKINVEEIEEILMRHPAIERVAVVGMPDARLGERCCAFVVTKPGAQAFDLAGLRAFMADLGVAKFKWPERVEERPSLPLTNIHKVHKAKLREEIKGILASEG